MSTSLRRVRAFQFRISQDAFAIPWVSLLIATSCVVGYYGRKIYSLVRTWRYRKSRSAPAFPIKVISREKSISPWEYRPAPSACNIVKVVQLDRLDQRRYLVVMIGTPQAPESVVQHQTP
jgi:hypothetical protein